MFRQLATDARGTRYQPKTLQPDAMRLISCCTSCLFLYSFRTASMVTPVLVVMSIHVDAPNYILPSAIATGFEP